MPQERIRVKAVMVIEHQGLFLFEKSLDSVKRSSFYMPFGGGVEFGESTRDAAVREVKEELGIDVPQPLLLAVKENLFTHDGIRGHDIVFVYGVKLGSQFERGLIVPEVYNGRPLEPVWLSADDLESAPFPIYPEGLVDILTSNFVHPLSSSLAHG